ncbi:hypothetical protein IU431_05045 [Nocardia otitidiscaviarum]|nr:hypothetical protein [Nocardia otitidiscaviarum]MBF6483521.1 hypothetical protein [Nocardia otitidiscaviarum]
MKTWRAASWEREQWPEFMRWRTAGGGVAEGQLTTLLDAVRWTALELAPDRQSVQELAERLDDVVTRCNDLAFDTRAEITAYALLHLGDRYGRACQVLEHLMGIGHLPLRRTHLNILDVGSGPAPNLYAAADFYASITDWVTLTGQDLTFATVTKTDSIDRGPGWGHLIHMVSERLVDLRGTSPTSGYVYPFHVTYHDFARFSSRQKWRQAFHDQVGAIRSQYDFYGEYIPEHSARKIAAEELPRFSYDLIFLSNFLTQPSMVDTFESELQELSESLTRGGLIIIMGSAGEQYQQIWDRIDHLMAETCLDRVEEFDRPVSTADGVYARRVHEHTLQSLDRLRAADLNVSEQFYREHFPSFRVMVWKRRTGLPPVEPREDCN